MECVLDIWMPGAAKPIMQSTSQVFLIEDADLKPLIEFAYLTGWRLASEVLLLEWRNVDLKAGEVHIDAGASKNGEPRLIYMSQTRGRCWRRSRPNTRS